MVLPLRKPVPAPSKGIELDDRWLTAHARARMGERGVSEEAIEMVITHADIRIASRGCERRRLSRGMAKRLDGDRTFTRATIEEARNTVVVTSPEGHVVTVIKCTPDVAFRRVGARPTRQRRWRLAEDGE